MTQKIYLIITALIIVGCATTGVKIDESQLTFIEPNVTTEQEVLKQLGSPNFKQFDSEGNVIYQYIYSKASNKPSNFIPVVNIFSYQMDVDTQQVLILFNEDGTVKKFTSNNSESEIKSGLVQ